MSESEKAETWRRIMARLERDPEWHRIQSQHAAYARAFDAAWMPAADPTVGIDLAAAGRDHTAVIFVMPESAARERDQLREKVAEQARTIEAQGRDLHRQTDELRSLRAEAKAVDGGKVRFPVFIHGKLSLLTVPELARRIEAGEAELNRAQIALALARGRIAELEARRDGEAGSVVVDGRAYSAADVRGLVADLAAAGRKARAAILELEDIGRP